MASLGDTAGYVEQLEIIDYCRDFLRGGCTRGNCRFVHEIPPKSRLKESFHFCHDFQNKGCYRKTCKFVHCTTEEEQHFYNTGIFPQNHARPPFKTFLRGDCAYNNCELLHPAEDTSHLCNKVVPPFTRPPPFIGPTDCSPPEAKHRRMTFDTNFDNENCASTMPPCPSCESLEHKLKVLHQNISVLLKEVSDLSEKNNQLTSMNEFLLEQTASLRDLTREQSCVITSRHCTATPVSLATVSMTPVVSLSGALPALVPGAPQSIALTPAASRAQLLTPASQLLTVSTTQQLMGNSGTLIVTSAGAQTLMQVSDSGTLVGAGQTVLMTPAQLTLAPPAQQLLGAAPPVTVQQLVQHSAQHQAQQLAVAQQSVHLAAAQHSAQQLAAAQHSVQQMAAAQTVQHLQSAQHMAVQHAAQESAQQLAQQTAQQLAAQQQLNHSTQQLVHQPSSQQITISSTSQQMALSNCQAQPISFSVMSQNILPH